MGTISLEEAIRACKSLTGESSLPSVAPLAFEECMMEWKNKRTLGKIEPSGKYVSTFEPFEKYEQLPFTNTEVRIRHSNGSLRAIILRNEESRVWLMRAPSRRERRAHPRVEVKGIALIQFANDSREGVLQDLSEGGIGISIPMFVEVGESVRFLLKLHGISEVALECEGVIANCHAIRPGSGMYRTGIRFTSLPENILKAIRKEIRRNLI
ncbi:MAG TPA: PilZ domain-containing protein [Fimbriimonadales bacterium]|nr:PilZ domain-containing protein [Fimbriimonadales bacterium]